MNQWEAEERLRESIRVLEDVCRWPYRAMNEDPTVEQTQPGGQSPKFSYDAFKRALAAVDEAALEFGRAQQLAPIESQEVRAVG